MKKIEKPEINIELKADWQKSLAVALLISVTVFALATAYLFIKPIEKSIAEIIDEEISSTNIIFNKKTLELLKERQTPIDLEVTSSGKNPFAPF